MLQISDSCTEISSVTLSKVFSISSFQQSSSHYVSEPGIQIVTEKGQEWILLNHLRVRAGKTFDCTLPGIFTFVPCKMGPNFREIWYLKVDDHFSEQLIFC